MSDPTPDRPDDEQQQPAQRPVRRADDYQPPGPDDADQGEPGGDE